jgi:hypothetical protein
MSGAFPEDFAALEPFAEFALPTERARHAAIQTSSLAVVQSFYGTMLPVLPAALDHLNGFPLGDMPAPQRSLLDLCLAMAEAAMAIENYGALNPPYLMPVDRFEPAHDNWEAAR